MVIIFGKYIKPLEVIDALLADHRRFLDTFLKESKFICYGPQNPRVGGVILASVGLDEVREILKSDPFNINKAVEYQFVEFSPVNCNGNFLSLSKREIQEIGDGCIFGNW